MHPMQPILIVGHPDRAQAYEALKHITVEYAEEEPVLSIEDSLAKKQLLRGEDNSSRNSSSRKATSTKASPRPTASWKANTGSP